MTFKILYIDLNEKISKQSGIELLRIVAMLWIIMFHFADHGKVNMEISTFNFSWAILAFARIGGGLGNCVFVLISGYLLYDKQFKMSRILKLWGQVFLYSVTIGLLCYSMSIIELTPKSVIKMFFPITFNEYWYMSTYVILYFLYPYLNTLIDNLNRKQFQILLILTIMCFSVIPTFVKANWLTGTNNLPIFITLFLIGAYIKKFNILGFKRNLLNFFCFFACGIMIFGSELLLKIMGYKDPFYFSWKTYKFPIVVMAIFMFLVFKNLQLKRTKVISHISKTIFGVYLIHMGRIGNYLFKIIINNEIVYNKPILMFGYLIVCTMCIFIVCSAIDY